jgi:putative PEP-CTERM system histidine kinase
MTALWGLVLAGQAMMGARAAWITVICEALRYGAWLTVLRALSPGTPRWLRRGSLGLVALICAYAAAGWLGAYTHFYALPLTDFVELSGFALAFTGLVATEQSLRDPSTPFRRNARLCMTAIGAQFAFDLFLFSQAMLLGAVEPGAWSLRGLFLGVLMVPFTMGARRVPAAEPSVFVSRHVVFYSSAFVAVGLYLSLMALGGLYVRRHGGNWGNALQLLFVLGAIGVLGWLLLAESPLRRLRVFIATHFYRNKNDYRVAWMRFVQTLSASGESDILRTAVRAVAQIFGSPAGLLMLKDDGAPRFALRAAWPESFKGSLSCGAIGENDPLPAFLRGRQWVIDLKEYRERPEFYGPLELPVWLDAQGPWRIIAPLLVGSELIGFLILRQPPEPFTMNFEDRDLLKTAGRNVAVQLAQHRADEKLAESRQFDAYNRFAAFVMHDLKNSVAQLQLLVANAARHRSNPVFFDDAIGTIQNTAERMTRLIEQLQSRDMQGTARQVDVTAVARAAVARSAARQPVVVMQPQSRELPVNADPERLGAIIDHVIRNAQEATPSHAAVALRIDAIGTEAHIHVIDEGMGMDDEFMSQRLFRPFDSTKGSKGMGIGAYQAREYARWLGGDVEVQSMPGRGTDFCIRLPLCQKTSRNC